MQKTKLLIASVSLAALAALGGCFPGVYKVDIQQGNVVTQDMIDQLRPGMTYRQVRFILGTPLITDTFHPNRWDYLYSFQAGGSSRLQERISLVFDDNERLIGMAGDFMPGVSKEQALLGDEAPTSAPTMPSGEPTDSRPAPGSLLEQIQREVDSAESAPVPEPEPLETEPQETETP